MWQLRANRHIFLPAWAGRAGPGDSLTRVPGQQGVKVGPFSTVTGVAPDYSPSHHPQEALPAPPGQRQVQWGAQDRARVAPSGDSGYRLTLPRAGHR